MKLHYTTIFIAGLMLLATSTAVVAQQPSKTKNTGLGDPTVEVVTDYRGKILETDKIDLKYTSSRDSLIYLNTTFTYPSFITTDMQSWFSLEPIQAMSMATDNLVAPNIGYGYLRAAFLYPVAPELDLYLHSPLSKKSTVNIYLKHRSFWGKSPLYDRAPVTPLPIVDEILSEHETTKAGLFMQHLFKHAAIDVRAEYRHQSLLYYGHDTLFLKENMDNGYTEKLTDNSYVRDFMRQAFNIVKADARVYSLGSASRAVSFNLRGYFDYIGESAHRFNTKSISQHLVGLHSFFRFNTAQNHAVTLQLDAKAYNRDNLSQRLSSGIANITPAYIYHNRFMEAAAGVNVEGLYDGRRLRYNLYPFLTFHFIAWEGLLIPYLEVTGGSTLNNYEKIISENPYVLPGLDVSNTRNRIHGEAGIKGSFSTLFAYRVRASYTMIDSMYFFVNSTAPIDNRGTINPSGAFLSNFDVAYDNISKLSLGVELSARFHNIEALLSADYVKYKMDMEAQPWHRPTVEAALQCRYKLNPLIFTLDALYRGETPVRLSDAYAAPTASTKAYVNLGLTAEYRITDKFSVFLQGRNLLNQSYQNYYIYYQPGITVGGGLTLSF
jgi:hypothetical protein